MLAGTQSVVPVRDIASTRILRLAVGIALALAFSQAINWPASFIVPVLVSVILSLPLPALSVRGGILFVVVLVVSLVFGLVLLPMLHHQPLAGVLLAGLAVFGCYYYGARGGSPIVSMFALLGATIVPVIGSESIDGAIALSRGLGIGALVAVVFVWIAFALFPDPPAPLRPAAAAGEPQPPPSARDAAMSALRSLLIVAPVFLWLLLSSGTASYAVVLIKVGQMGQQVSMDGTRAAGRELLQSTLIGGVAAIILWNVLQIWPNLVMYSLLFLLCGLLMGRRIFSGPGLAPGGPVWSYGLLTMMVILAPAALDGAGGSNAGGRFGDRIVMFVLATLYAVVAVYVFDSLRRRRSGIVSPG